MMDWGPRNLATSEQFLDLKPIDNAFFGDIGMDIGVEIDWLEQL